MWYWVSYNGNYIASFKSLKRCVSFIDRKKIYDDNLNKLYIVDQEGNLYNTNGYIIK